MPVLHEIRITGLGVIDDAVLAPGAGFTVVTGETGAGKTMIVTALGLICGSRGDAARVRVGAPRAVVEARLQLDSSDPDSPGAATVAAVGGDLDEDGSVIAIRSVGVDGRSRAHIGGRAAPVSALAELTGPLVTIHGQSEATSLLAPAHQRAVLDTFAGLGGQLDRYRALRREWQGVVVALADRTGRARERAQREQVLRLGVDEIAAVAPTPGEDAALLAEVRRLENADALREAAAGALADLSGSDRAPDAPTAAALVQAAGRLLDGAADDRLRNLTDGLRQAAALVGDVSAELVGYLADLDADPERLDQLLARQSVLRSLTRRYGQDVDAVLAWSAEARAELAGLDSSEESLRAIVARRDELATALSAAGAALSEQRKAAAGTLGAAATEELANLAMGRASLRVSVSQRTAKQGADDAVPLAGSWVAAGPDGIDHVEIVLTAHDGAPELPIGRGASGGELSRVMLALEVVLAGADPVGTLVFDEIDAGVGGRAATQIGRRLAMLAASHQVIVVTHLAQVAAFADRHFVVDADADGTVGVSSVREVTGEQREAELARMLGGTDGTVARAHAADLLAAASAGGSPGPPRPRPASRRSSARRRNRPDK